MAEPIFEYGDFKGIANNTDDRRIPKGFLSVGINVDIDDEKRVMRRLGQTQILPGNAHSLWSNGKVCLFVDSGSLKSMNPDWSQTVLLSGLSNAGMVYADDGVGKVYFSNNEIVGYVEGGIGYAFPEPEQTFKKRMIGGHLLEYFNSRLYAARGDLMVFSDAVAPMRYDPRKNFKQFPGFIKMMSAVSDGVSDGMYISSGDLVYFMAGGDPQGASLIKVTDSPAILYSAIKVEGENVGKGLLGTVALWLSEDGVFIGAPGGECRLLNKYYSAEGLETGAAIYRFDRGFGQYLCVCEFLETEGMGEGSFDIPSLSMSGSNY